MNIYYDDRIGWDGSRTGRISFNAMGITEDMGNQVQATHFVKPLNLSAAVHLAVEGWVFVDETVALVNYEFAPVSYGRSKFYDTLSEVLHQATMEQWEDELVINEGMGSVAWLFENEMCILTQDDQGFVGTDVYDTIRELFTDWRKLRAEANEQSSEEEEQGRADAMVDSFKEHGTFDGSDAK